MGERIFKDALPNNLDACNIAIADLLDRYAICVLDYQHGSVHLLEMAKVAVSLSTTTPSFEPIRLVSTILRGEDSARFVVSTLTEFVFVSAFHQTSSNPAYGSFVDPEKARRVGENASTSRLAA